MQLPDYIRVSPVIIIERDYKGSYERYALTPSEFHNKYGSLPNIEYPTGTFQSYTIKPMVHISYRMAFIGGEEWNKFFGDMTYGLPDYDIEHGNKAYIRSDLMESLVGFCQPYA